MTGAGTSGDRILQPPKLSTNNRLGANWQKKDTRNLSLYMFLCSRRILHTRIFYYISVSFHSSLALGLEGSNAWGGTVDPHVMVSNNQLELTTSKLPLLSWPCNAVLASCSMATGMACDDESSHNQMTLGEWSLPPAVISVLSLEMASEGDDSILAPVSLAKTWMSLRFLGEKGPHRWT